MPGLERVSVRDFHSGSKSGSLCSGFIQAKQEFGGNVKRTGAETVNGILWKMLRGAQVPPEHTSKGQ